MRNRPVTRFYSAHNRSIFADVQVPERSATAQLLRHIEKTDGTVIRACEAIGDGWGVGDEVSFSPLMIAAALEKEALSNDAIVDDAEESAETINEAYAEALRLRRLVAMICSYEAARMTETDC